MKWAVIMLVALVPLGLFALYRKNRPERFDQTDGVILIFLCSVVAAAVILLANFL